MKQSAERLLLLTAILIGLGFAWVPLLDDKATEVVDRGLGRSMVTFGSARLLNAALSIVESIDVSVKPFGLGTSVAIGKAVHPVNELVAQFAELMLAASVVFGLMKVLIIIGSSKGVCLLLTFAALYWTWLSWHRKLRSPWIAKALLVLVLIRFAVPIVSFGSEWIFSQLLSDSYQTAQSGITGGSTKWETFKEWMAPTTDIGARVNVIEKAAENWAKHIVDLIVLFLLQTMILPLALFWLLCRIGATTLTLKPRNG